MNNNKRQDLERILSITGELRKILFDSGVPEEEVDRAMYAVMGTIDKALRFVVGVQQEKARIIVIDDEESILKFMLRHFKSRGYDVIATVDPEVCAAFRRDTLCENIPGVRCGDLLLTDNIMPRIRGIAFLESQQQRDCKLPMKNKAVMSGNFGKEDIERIDSLGCARFDKPISFVALDAWASQCVLGIDKTRRLREIAQS